MEKIITIKNIGSCTCPECRGTIFHVLKEHYDNDSNFVYVYNGYQDHKYTYDINGFNIKCMKQKICKHTPYSGSK